jgi:predicted DNA-binding antitoxin AbrB/MazE fold protein
METIEAIYEHGVFRPVRPVTLPENCRVQVIPPQVIPPTVNGELNQDLDAIHAVMDLRFASGEHDVAERHNEHQP